MISVGILTRNRLAQLKLCVASMASQLSPQDEILVLDTGSSDGTQQWVGEQGELVRLLTPASSGTGFGEGRNQLALAATQELLAFTDDDCVCPPGWIDRIVQLLQTFDAVGGLSLPGRLYDFPWWWSAELAWTIGMTGDRMLSGSPHEYPAGSNLAGRVSVFRTHPFGTTAHSFDSNRIYLGGREDAEWWREARRQGLRVRTDPELIVYHTVSADRFRFSYVLRRARTDGTADWLRAPRPGAARLALSDFWDSLLDPFVSPLNSLLRPRAALARFLWAARQFEFLRAARPTISAAAFAHAGVRSALAKCRNKAASTVLAASHTALPRFRIPESPRVILIAAPTYLGDSVLLRPVLNMLCRTWPESRIVLWTRYPSLFQDLRVQTTETCTRALASAADIVFAPYYHFGSAGLWRTALARKAVTYSWDVGFRYGFDYRLSALRVEKQQHQHEILNHLHLFSQWPLAGALERTPLVVSEEAQSRVNRRYGALSEPFAAIQTTAALDAKQWPLDRYASMARALRSRTGLRIVFIGGTADGTAADAIIREQGLEDGVNACGMPADELVAAISRARIVVGPCSGPKHIAMSLGVPTFCLYAITYPDRWGALFDRDIHGYVCSPAVSLSPIERAGLPPDHEMRLITAESATEALLDHIGRVL